MAWIKVGAHLINEDEIIAISAPRYGSNAYEIRLRCSQLIEVSPTNDEYSVKNLYDRYLSETNSSEKESETVN